MKSQKQSFLPFIEKTVKGAGAILLTFKDSYQIKKTKDTLSLDIATSADYASENYIISQIQSSFSGHSIYTEETEGLTNKSEYEWIIDPLDGTKEYVRHIPYYYTLLALEHKGSLICAAGYQPEIKRLFSCETPQTAKMNGSRVHVSAVTDLAKSFIAIALPNSRTPPEDTGRYFAFLQHMNYRAYKLRNTAWDVESLFNVAMGAMDGYVTPTSSRSPGPKWWDIAPGILMVEAAGGMVTDFYGKPIKNRDISRGIVASNGLIHGLLLQEIKDEYLA